MEMRDDQKALRLNGLLSFFHNATRLATMSMSILTKEGNCVIIPKFAICLKRKGTQFTLLVLTPHIRTVRSNEDTALLETQFARFS